MNYPASDNPIVLNTFCLISLCGRVYYISSRPDHLNDHKKVIQFPFLHPLIIFQTNQNPSILLSSTKPDLTGTCYSNVPERYFKPKCE